MTDSFTSASAPTIFQFRSTEVRTLVLDGEVWFVASDVAKALAFRDASNMVRMLDDDERGTRVVSTPSGDQEMIVINESGLYHAVLKSRKPEAKPFRKWVTAEVLPTIRKTGQYVAQPYAHNPGDALTKDQADTLRKMMTEATERLPKERQGAFARQGWSKLKAHFKVGYREIPQAEFTEAVSLLARHIAEGELIDVPPQRVLMVMRGKQIISSQVVNGSCVIDPKSGPDLISLIGEFVPFERLQDVINTAHRRIMNRFESIQRVA